MSPIKHPPSFFQMYMSPELVLCRGHSTKTDIYSLGTTIIHMQTGSPPWVRRYPRTAYPSYLYIVSTAHENHIIWKWTQPEWLVQIFVVLTGWICDIGGKKHIWICVPETSDDPKVGCWCLPYLGTSLSLKFQCSDLWPSTFPLAWADLYA